MTLQRMALLGVQSYNPNTLLLVPGTGANNSTTILDTSQYGRTITVNGDAITTTTVADPFGANNGVMTFDGSGDSLRVAYNSILDLNVPHTLEFFFRRAANVSVGLFGKEGGTGGWGGLTSIEMTIYITGSLLYVQRVSFSGGIITFQVAPPALNTWTHFATSYDGTTTRCFLGGVSFGTPSTTAVGKPATSNFYLIGQHTLNSAFFMNGQTAQFRHSAGALYTSNFTPPSAPFVP